MLCQNLIWIKDNIKNIRKKTQNLNIWLSVWYLNSPPSVEYIANMLTMPKIKIEMIAEIIAAIHEVFEILAVYLAAALRLLPSTSKILTSYQSLKNTSPDLEILSSEFKIVLISLKLKPFPGYP